MFIISTTDRRIQRTRKSLGDALVALVLEKDDVALTIREITERANVAYATFFRHYKSIDELLIQVLEEGLEVLEVSIDQLTQEVKDISQVEGFFIFKHVREQQHFYRILLNSPDALRARKMMHKTIAYSYYKGCREYHNSAYLPLNVAANHIAASLLVVCQTRIVGYRRWSLIRASSVVNCQ